MQIHITPRHLRLTAAIHAAVAAQVEQLENHGVDILSAHVVLVATEEASARYTAKVHLAVPGPDIFAEDTENDLYAALELCTAKLARQLRKRKTAVKDARRSKTQKKAEGAKAAGVPLQDRRLPRVRAKAAKV